MFYKCIQIRFFFYFFLFHSQVFLFQFLSLSLSIFHLSLSFRLSFTPSPLRFLHPPPTSLPPLFLSISLPGFFMASIPSFLLPLFSLFLFIFTVYPPPPPFSLPFSRSLILPFCLLLLLFSPFFHSILSSPFLARFLHFSLTLFPPPFLLTPFSRPSPFLFSSLTHFPFFFYPSFNLITFIANAVAIYFSFISYRMAYILQ